MPDNFLCKPRNCRSADGFCSSAALSGSSSIYSSGGSSGDNAVIEGGLVSEKHDLSGEWDDASESWANFVRGGKDYYRDEMNNPAAFKLIGNVRNKRVLDLSCGEGYNARLLAERGARVVGVDFSEKMIELAKQTEKREAGHKLPRCGCG